MSAAPAPANAIKATNGLGAKPKARVQAPYANTAPITQAPCLLTVGKTAMAMAPVRAPMACDAAKAPYPSGPISKIVVANAGKRASADEKKVAQKSISIALLTTLFFLTKVSPSPNDSKTDAIEVIFLFSRPSIVVLDFMVMRAYPMAKKVTRLKA